MTFPSWRYHRTKPARIVHDPIEDEALGEGWADTPAAFESEPEPDDENEGAEDGEENEPELSDEEKKKIVKRLADKARRDAAKAAKTAAAE